VSAAISLAENTCSKQFNGEQVSGPFLPLKEAYPPRASNYDPPGYRFIISRLKAHPFFALKKNNCLRPPLLVLVDKRSSHSFNGKPLL